VIGYGQGLASPKEKRSISYGYAANAQYLSVISGIVLMLFVLLF